MKKKIRVAKFRALKNLGEADFKALIHKCYGYFQAPSGHMWGTFRMERQDGEAFDCVIPPFSLESKYDDPTNGEPILGN